MTTAPNKFYYISSGAKNAMRTLRFVVNVPGVYFTDEYICNLARDYNTAVEKARSMIGTKATLMASDFDLNEWGQGFIPMKDWMKRQLVQVESGVMPFGKHKGARMVDLDEGYVKYWVSQKAENPVGQLLVQKFTDIANERDYFTKWDAEAAEQQAAREAELENLNWVGNEGDRLVVFIRCDKRIVVEGRFGPYYINICKDRYGNEWVYAGSKGWTEGNYYKARVTIKAHAEYKGKKQNKIARPHIIKEVEATSDEEEREAA